MLVLFSDPDPAAGQSHHAFVYSQLEVLSKHPEFTYYLSYILMYLPQHVAEVREWIPHGGINQIEEIRSRAGLELKNRVKDTWPTIPGDTREYVKATALTVLSDPSQFLRNIVGTIVTTICKRGGLEQWPGVLEHLCRMLDSEHHTTMEGAFNALAKICEDMPKELDSDALQRPLNVMLPKFIALFLHPHQDIRKYALATVNVFLLAMPNALRTNIHAYMTNLFTLAGRDTTAEIRKRVCQAFVLLLEKEYHLLHPHISLVIEFMVAASNDADEQVCLEACEFWSAYCEIPQLNTALLANYLEHLIPILLKAMRYSPMELAVLGEDDEDDQLVPDRAEDLRPLFHRSAAASSGPQEVDEDDSDFEDDDDEDWQDQKVSDWSLRKCAAAALDTLAAVFRSDLLPHLLPKLQQALNSRSDNQSEEAQLWAIRESGVLALGAIAEGCLDNLREYLPQLIPHLITNFLTDKKPLVRSITCWTLSRYCKWIISETVTTCQGDHRVYFLPLLQQLLNKIRDKNKKVQEAACSAFATFEEEARTMIVPYLADILQTLMFAFGKYQAKNMLILYDAIGTLSEAVHVELNKPELIQILMPPLMHKWNTLADNDRNIFPLLECLTAIAHALGQGFLIYAEPIFLRCAKLIETNLAAQKEAEEAHARHIDVDFPDPEFVVCALDLMSGLAEGLEENIEGLVGKYDQRLLGLIFQCMQNLDPDTRQSAFALFGDLAKTCMGHLRPHLAHFLPICAANLNPEYYSVCNNASWAIGEISVKAGSEAMAPFVGEIMRFLTPILLERDPRQMRSLLENASITIGRLAYVCAPQVAPTLGTICVKWMQYLAPLKENQEKEHAFKGLSLAIQQNPMSILQAHAFPALTAAIASWKDNSATEINTIFHQLLHSYKTNLGPQWPQTFAQCDPKVQEIVRSRYQL